MSDLTAVKPVFAEPKSTQVEKLLAQLGRGLVTGAADDDRVTSETNFKGPNVNKRHRKPDEIYGDTSIPDSARKEQSSRRLRSLSGLIC
jgi:hypothetical protein